MRNSIIFTFLMAFFLSSCGGGDSTHTSTPAPEPPSVISVNDTGNKGAVAGANYNYKPTYQKIAKAPDPDRKLENANITVEIEGLPNGWCHLLGIYTDQFFMADSAKATNGKLTFKKNEPYKPGFYYLRFPDRKTSIQMLIDADQTFSLKTKMNSLANGMQVKGSLDNQLLFQTMKFESTQQPEFRRLAQQLKSHKFNTPEYGKTKIAQNKLGEERTNYLKKIFTEHPTSLFTAFKEGGQNPQIDVIINQDGVRDDADYVFKYKTEFWDNVNFDDNRLLYTPVISNKLKRYIDEFTAQNPDSIKTSADHLLMQTLGKDEFFQYFANWIVLHYEPTKTPLMDSEAVYVHMIQNYFTYERAFWSDSTNTHALQLRAHEMSNSLIGMQGPNVKAAGTDGKTRAIYDMDAKYIIVYMWNPGCEHCAEQTPQLVKFYHEWKPKGVDVYAIVVNTEDDRWKEGIKSYNMPWANNVHDPTNRNIYATYFVDNTPELYVLDPDRKIIGKNLKVDQLQIILERDMKKRGLM